MKTAVASVVSILIATIKQLNITQSSLFIRLLRTDI